MIRPLVLLHLAERLPLPSRSHAHRAGLHALAGASRARERLFECAARSYRRDLDVERLARVRVHQLIARHRAGTWPDAGRRDARDRARALRLTHIESLALRSRWWTRAGCSRTGCRIVDPSDAVAA